MSVVSKLQFTHASRSSHSWLSKQPQLVQSSKLLVARLSCPELGTAQPQLVSFFAIGVYETKYKVKPWEVNLQVIIYYQVPKSQKSSEFVFGK